MRPICRKSYPDLALCANCINSLWLHCFWQCWRGITKSWNRPVNMEWWGAGMVICLQRAANDLHMVQLMPLPPHRLLLNQNPPHHHHNRFTALFPGPPGWAGARRELLDFMVQGKINRGRHSDHLAGSHSIRTNQCPPPPSRMFFTGWMTFLPPNQRC